VKTVENGQKKHLIIFTHLIFFQSITKQKVENRMRLAKSGPSKMDKSEEKYSGIDRQTVI
jgi:hypothetical protein